MFFNNIIICKLFKSDLPELFLANFMVDARPH